jgi:SAM-dependent methyltransferase
MHFLGDVAGVERVTHDLRRPLPLDAETIDYVACLDVLEHVDDKERVFAELARVAARGVIVSLPNINCIDYLRNAILGRPLSKQYRFAVDDAADRHRWSPSYGDLFEWADNRTGLGFEVRCIGQSLAATRVVPLLLLPMHLKVFNVIFLFRKTRHANQTGADREAAAS